MSRVIAVVNSKGGTSKSTTAVNLAATAALRGQSALVVDLDKQRTTSRWLAVNEPDTGALLDTLLESRSLDPLTVATEIPGLDLVLGTAALGQTGRIQAEVGFHRLLRDSLAKTTARDWVFIDTSGDLGPATVMALAAAQEVLIPMLAGGAETDVLPDVMQTIATVQGRLNPDLRLAGVLLTKYGKAGRYDRVLSRDIAAQLRSELPGYVFETVVRESDRHPESIMWRKPIALHDPDGVGDQDYQAVFDELVARGVAVAGA